VSLTYSAELPVGLRFYRPNIDLSGPLNEDRLLYRLNAYEGSEGFRDFDQDVERVLLHLY